MSVEIIASWSVLMDKARALGTARVMHDPPEQIARLEKELKEYEEIIKMADKVV
jgi:hypothetical protein